MDSRGGKESMFLQAELGGESGDVGIEKVGDSEDES
jgi:hypothetical protein